MRTLTVARGNMARIGWTGRQLPNLALFMREALLANLIAIFIQIEQADLKSAHKLTTSNIKKRHA